MLLIASLLCCFVSRRIGILYMLLRVIGYVIDVRRKTIEPEKNPARLLLFFFFFPAVPMGPVTRYADLSKTLYAKHSFDINRILRGLSRALFGLFKKLVIADRLHIAVQTLSASPEQYGGAYVLLLMMFYTTQLYADFTGGIDIAIGIAEMLGVTLPENFNRPYGAKTLAEFWQRWHITLGTWFRDYVFYPLSTSTALASVTRLLRADKTSSSGHARTSVRTYFATRVPVWIPTLVVWFLTGLWHGFGWHFIVWGLLNGVIILVSRELTAWKSARFPDVLRVLRTLFIVASLRLLDCYQNVPLAFKQFATLFSVRGWSSVLRGGLFELGLSAADYVVVLLAVLFVWYVSRHGSVCSAPVAGPVEAPEGDFRTRLLSRPYAMRAVLFGGLFIATIVFGAYGQGYDASTFIYARF